MGKIYEETRKIKQEEMEKEYIIEDYQNFVTFYEFIVILSLYSDDPDEIVAGYLICNDDFLKIDHYIYDSIYSQMPEPNKFHIEYEAATESRQHEMRKEYMQNTFHRIKYSDIEDDTYDPTESFLEEVLDEHVEDCFDNKHWKIDDLLELDCIERIGFDKEAFDECVEALGSDANVLLDYKRKNKLLVEQLNILDSPNDSDSIIELSKARLKIVGQAQEIEALLSKINKLKDSALPIDDIPLHSRTANNASKIIGALTSELLNMDLTKPYAESSNGAIKHAIERQGNTVSKDVIADWLSLAHKNTM